MGDEPRGGAEWDPFSDWPHVVLSSGAQSELLGVLPDCSARDADWVKSVVLAALSLPLWKQVSAAVQRLGRSSSDEQEMMSLALTCATEGFGSWREGGAPFHVYVSSSVEAMLNSEMALASAHGSMPKSWRVALRLLPSIRAELCERFGRFPSVGEMRDEYVARSERWAEGVTLAAGEDDVQAGVRRRLQAAGVHAVARSFSEVCAVAAAPADVSAVAASGALPANAAAEDVALSERGESFALRLFNLVEQVDGGTVHASWAALSPLTYAVLSGQIEGTPVSAVRSAPTDAELISSWSSSGRDSTIAAM